MPSLYSKLRLAVDSMDAMLLLERGVKCDAPCTEVVYLWHRGLALSVVTSTVDPTHLAGRLPTPRGSPSRCARRRQASELLFGAFPTVIFSHGQERRSSARWEAVINASAAPYWETLVGQWGAARDVIVACVFAVVNISAAGGGAPRPVLLCPAFVVACAHRKLGIGKVTSP